jgi:hypothetical protein
MRKDSKIKKRKLNEFIILALKWLASSINLSYKETSYVLRVANKILRVLESRGKAEAIRYTKDLRLKFTKAILSMDPVTFERGDQLWLPKILVQPVNYIQECKSYPFIRLIFSSLYITRSVRLDDDISFDTIEKGPEFIGTPSSLDRDILSFLKDLGVNLNYIGKPPKSVRFKEFHMSSKSGPNGHALWTAFRDISALTGDQLESIRILAGPKLADLIVKFLSLYQKIPHFFDSRNPITRVPVTRRIAKINDKEGKTREVAIGDYYSQAALLPLHNYLYRILDRIHQDCTSDQIKLFYSLENSIGSSYHSIDLKAFTDRFPIVINHRILYVWFGSEYANAWRSLMVDTPFVYKGRKVTYATGTPMGMYSSFNSTALAHHFILWKACKMSNLRWKRARYMLLGDDIVIANDTLARNYKKLLTEWGVEIQHSKTHTSPHGFEFAKQIRLHGENVSPFPLSALFDRRTETIASTGIIFQELSYKRWGPELMSVLESYFVNVLGWKRPRFRSFKPSINLVISLLLTLQGKGSIGKAVVSYVRTTFPGAPRKWTKKVNKLLFYQWLTVKVTQSLYLESRERIVNKKTPGSLGDLATEMVLLITSLRDGGADCFDLIEAVPFLQVYGRAEEVFLKSFDNLYDYGMGSQPSSLRSLLGKVDIPLSDEGFYVRHRDVLVVQSMKASRIITGLLKETTIVEAYNGTLRFEVPWAEAIRKRKSHRASSARVS